MPVVSVTKDLDALTLTLVVDLTAPPERVWQVWTDPRQAERWWGPPTWPATFLELDASVGGRGHYLMTGPDGEQAHGWWRFEALDEPRSLEVTDGFADADGAPDDAMPVTRMRVTLEATATGTLMTTATRVASREQLEQLLAMGMDEGMREAAGQLDALVAA